MINIDFTSVKGLKKAFPTEKKCIKHLEALRWGNNVVSPFDSSSIVYKCAGNKYKCHNSGKYFNVRTNTLFHGTRVPLQKWFIAIFLMQKADKIPSSIKLAKELKLTQKTAWYVQKRIKDCFGMPTNKEISERLTVIERKLDMLANPALMALCKN